MNSESVEKSNKEFKASEGWLYSFIKHYHLKIMRLSAMAVIEAVLRVTKTPRKK